MRSDLEIDRLREKFPRSAKALVQLYPGAWDRLLVIIEQAMDEGKVASVIAGKLSILRGLDRDTRHWVVLSIQADRREILYRGQRSFLTELFDRTLDDILAELKDFETQHASGRATPGPQQTQTSLTLISHDMQHEGALALQLAEAIEAAGPSCWLAPRNMTPDAKWNDEVYAIAQTCGALVLLLSPSAAQSPRVAGEVQIAVGRAIPVIVVKLADLDPARIDIGLATYEHIDWINRDAADLPDLADKLAAALKSAALLRGIAA